MPTLKFLFSVMKILDMLSFTRYVRLEIYVLNFILYFGTIRLSLINSIANVASRTSMSCWWLNFSKDSIATEIKQCLIILQQKVFFQVQKHLHHHKLSANIPFALILKILIVAVVILILIFISFLIWYKRCNVNARAKSTTTV